MSKAEERVLKAYPKETRDIEGIVVDIGHPQYMRDFYIEGYRQAEKDLELTWRDMEQILDIINNLVDENFNADDFGVPANKEFYQEVLKRFKDLKHVK